MSRYSITVTREDGSWLASADDVAGVHTWARSLPALERSIREALALALDLPDGAEDSIELDLRYEVYEDAVRQAAQLGDLRRALEAQERANAEAVPAAVADLLRAGYSVRDAAVLLGMSPGRISQITAAGLPQTSTAEDAPTGVLEVIMLVGDPGSHREKEVHVVPALRDIVIMQTKLATGVTVKAGSPLDGLIVRGGVSAPSRSGPRS